jgi:hypothetical protein
VHARCPRAARRTRGNPGVAPAQPRFGASLPVAARLTPRWRTEVPRAGRPVGERHPLRWMRVKRSPRCTSPRRVRRFGRLAWGVMFEWSNGHGTATSLAMALERRRTGVCTSSGRRGRRREVVGDGTVSRESGSGSRSSGPGAGEMGTDMHIASGWEAQESHGHGHTGNGVMVQRTLQRSKASRSSGCAARNGEGEGSDGDIADAAGEGNALEGVASARRARPPVLRGTAEHKTR